jgi:hypothetical protein
MITSKKKVALITTLLLHRKWDELFNYCLQLGLNPLVITEEMNGTYIGGEAIVTVERKIRTAIEGVPNVKS